MTACTDSVHIYMAGDFKGIVSTGCSGCNCTHSLRGQPSWVIVYVHWGIDIFQNKKSFFMCHDIFSSFLSTLVPTYLLTRLYILDLPLWSNWMKEIIFMPWYGFQNHYTYLNGSRPSACVGIQIHGDQTYLVKTIKTHDFHTFKEQN